ncbi:peptidylprolyl isomerase [Mucilaginibacter robiniae]|uniref:Peptidyl-prolyl cis-trans isomerase n=1 Tax=Mucilaginibacter robiniae TaxID=2728022 RepID=A0A7L5E0I4_9SPHI|nr:FKBP-type peptidyl-prolyl cis-trans isomerase [Mucilaginibacter robiniae]QJD95877.1 peptidylprolyl isomerase [Mucilaginibacter robiniae]
MKQITLICCFITLIFSGCKKDESTTEQATDDDAKIQAYIKANNIKATKDASGLYYQIITPGTGNYPNSNSNVSVNYTGKLLDGTVFETSSLSYSPLSGLIQGWQIGIPHINVGGRILLLVPSALGYGTAKQDNIPANSVLVFTIDLIGFK